MVFFKATLFASITCLVNSLPVYIVDSMPMTPPLFPNIQVEEVVWGFATNEQGYPDWAATEDFYINAAALNRYSKRISSQGREIKNGEILESLIGPIARYIDVDRFGDKFEELTYDLDMKILKNDEVLPKGEKVTWMRPERPHFSQVKRFLEKFLVKSPKITSFETSFSPKSEMSLWRDHISSVSRLITGLLADVSTGTANLGCEGGVFTIYDTAGSTHENSLNILNVAVSAFQFKSLNTCQPSVGFSSLWKLFNSQMDDWHARNVSSGCATIDDGTGRYGNIRVMGFSLLEKYAQDIWALKCPQLS